MLHVWFYLANNEQFLALTLSFSHENEPTHFPPQVNNSPLLIYSRPGEISLSCVCVDSEIIKYPLNPTAIRKWQTARSHNFFVCITSITAKISTAITVSRKENCATTKEFSYFSRLGETATHNPIHFSCYSTDTVVCPLYSNASHMGVV